MKTYVLAASFLVCTIALIAGGCKGVPAKGQTTVARHKPSGGHVSDAEAALKIGKAVLGYLLTPDDFRRKEFSEAKLKDGVWTVRYWEPKTRINFPVVIQIRQNTGGIIRYEDPNT